MAMHVLRYPLRCLTNILRKRANLAMESCLDHGTRGRLDWRLPE